MEAEASSAFDGGTTDSSDGASFDVGSLQGLVMWLTSQRGASPGRWIDQSPAANDAVQTVSGNQPTIQGLLNGFPIVHFEQNQFLNVTGNSSLTWGTSAFLVEIVARLAGTNVEVLYQLTEPTKGYGLFFRTRATQAGRAPMSGFFVLPGDEVNQIVSVESTSAKLDDGVARLYTLARRGTGAATAIEIGINGTVETTATGSQYAFDVSPATGPRYAGLIGVISSGSIEIAEIILVRGDLPPETRATLEGHLKTKYAL